MNWTIFVLDVQDHVVKLSDENIQITDAVQDCLIFIFWSSVNISWKLLSSIMIKGFWNTIFFLKLLHMQLLQCSTAQQEKLEG